MSVTLTNEKHIKQCATLNTDWYNKGGVTLSNEKYINECVVFVNDKHKTMCYINLDKNKINTV